MGLIKIIAVIGIAALVMQSTSSTPVNSANCKCTREFDPVCASNGVTYSNDCLFYCEKQKNHELTIRFHGECDEVADIPLVAENKCICTMEFLPVCGNDRNTYSNKCEFSCKKEINAKLEITHEGECEDAAQVLSMNELFDCACPLILMPVCGNDDRTYDNQCTFNCAKRRNKHLEIKHQGNCDDVDILPVKEVQQLPSLERLCICPAIYEPVCGSDQETYSNRCLLECEQRTKINLIVKHTGSC